MDQVNMFLLLVIVSLVIKPKRVDIAKLCGIAAVFSFFIPLFEAWGKQ